MRKYEVIWDKIKDADSAAGQWTVVKVSNKDMISTIVNMVMQEKSNAHRLRLAIGLPGYGKLEIKREPEKLQVSFRLRNAGALL
jgi:hypothetical protein